MFALLKVQSLISNTPEGPRNEVYTWDKWYPDLDSFPLAQQQASIKKVKKYFKEKSIKWWCLYEIFINTSKGVVEFKLIENESHEELPPLELNVVAKGWAPPPPKPKKTPVKKPKIAAGLQFSLPTASPVTMEAGAQAFANFVQSSVDTETEV
jgi:hypothetical protein